MKTALAVFLSLALATGVARENGRSASERGAFGCKPVDLSQADDTFTFAVSRHFGDVQQAAVALNTRFCEALNSPVSAGLPTRELAAFGVLAAARGTEAFAGTAEEDGVAETLQLFADVLNRGEAFPATMPDFEVFTPAGQIADEPVAYSLTAAGAREFLVTPAGNDTCVGKMQATCSAVLRDLDNAIRPYKLSYRNYLLEGNADKLESLQQGWNRFFDVSRSMTTLDLVLTSVLEKDHMRQGYLVGPVERQWFALHPNAILQYSDDVPRGERFEPGLSVEWFGVNYWQDGPLGFPFGASLTSVYSDRAGLASVGHGITLHIDNRYSIGWASHSGSDSFYVSADLLALFREKQRDFERYKEKVMAFR